MFLIIPVIYHNKA